MVLFLLSYFEKNSIFNVKLILKNRVKAHLYTLIRLLTLHHIVIISLLECKKVAHNGVKSRKQRRV